MLKQLRASARKCCQESGPKHVFLKSPKDTFSQGKSTKYEEGSTKFNAAVHVSHELKPCLSNVPSTMKYVASEPSKYQNSDIGSRVLRLSERRRLESRATLLEESLMAIEKKERELVLKRKQRDVRIEERRGETELAHLRDQTFPKMMQEMKHQTEEAEGSCHGSTVSPSPSLISELGFEYKK